MGEGFKRAERADAMPIWRPLSSKGSRVRVPWLRATGQRGRGGRALVVGLGRLDHYSWRERQQFHARLNEAVFDPMRNSPVQLQPSVLRELGYFPTGNDTDAKISVRASLKKLTMFGGQSVRLRDPPDPNVGVQQDHRDASQSSLATGSNGSRYSRTESRRSGVRPPDGASASGISPLRNSSKERMRMGRSAR